MAHKHTTQENDMREEEVIKLLAMASSKRVAENHSPKGSLYSVTSQKCGIPCEPSSLSNVHFWPLLRKCMVGEYVGRTGCTLNVLIRVLSEKGRKVHRAYPAQKKNPNMLSLPI